MKRTPLHSLHAELGARMVPFAGWEMPLQYGEGLRCEHLWTRAHAGLFDVSHMGQVRCTGEDLAGALEATLPVDFDGWSEGAQKYSLLLNEAGGIEDDLMVARLADEVRIVVNAAGREHDLALLRTHAPGLRFELLDRALLAVQGPAAREVIPEADGLAFMQCAALRIAGVECFVSRSGYTGEDGFEVSVPAEAALALARHFLSHPQVRPVGLGARDTLRLEAALPLHGNDIDEQTTPHEAGLAWAIAPARRPGGAKAGGFPGAEALAKAQIGRRLRYLVGETNVPVRAGTMIVDEAGLEVGRVTSGTVSPSLGKPIAMAYVSTAVAGNAKLWALVRGNRQGVSAVKPPFVPKRYKR